MFVFTTQLASSTEKSDTPLTPVNLLKDEIDQVANIYNVIIEFFTNYSFQLVGAFIIFIIGYMFAGKVSSWVLKLCQRNELDITLSQFLANTTKMLVVIMIAVIALSKLGYIRPYRARNVTKPCWLFK